MTPEREALLRKIVQRGFFSEREGDPSPVYACRDLIDAIDVERAACAQAKRQRDEAVATAVMAVGVADKTADLLADANRERDEARAALARVCVPTTQNGQGVEEEASHHQSRSSEKP